MPSTGNGHSKHHQAAVDILIILQLLLNWGRENMTCIVFSWVFLYLALMMTAVIEILIPFPILVEQIELVAVELVSVFTLALVLSILHTPFSHLVYTSDHGPLLTEPSKTCPHTENKIQLRPMVKEASQEPIPDLVSCHICHIFPSSRHTELIFCFVLLVCTVFYLKLY